MERKNYIKQLLTVIVVLSDVDIPNHYTNRKSEMRHIVFYTGAGMSRESGLPTFRGDGGLWYELGGGSGQEGVVLLPSSRL